MTLSGESERKLWHLQALFDGGTILRFDRLNALQLAHNMEKLVTDARNGVLVRIDIDREVGDVAKR